MPKFTSKTHIVSKFSGGKDVVAPKAENAGRSAKKNIVLGVGKLAFGVGAAAGAVHGFAKGFWS